jgi:hypothetical protein
MTSPDELYGMIYSPHWVYCGECKDAQERTTKLSKDDFKRYLKKNKWKFRGRPRQWVCPECVEKIKQKLKDEQEKKDGKNSA